MTHQSSCQVSTPIHFSVLNCLVSGDPSKNRWGYGYGLSLPHRSESICKDKCRNTCQNAWQAKFKNLCQKICHMKLPEKLSEYMSNLSVNIIYVARNVPRPHQMSEYVVYGVNAPRRAWFFPRLWSLAVYVFNALADCNSLRWRYRRHVAQLCCWRLATLTGRGGGGGMITFLSTVRWRYRRHVAQLCCWRLATLTGRGGFGGGW